MNEFIIPISEKWLHIEFPTLLQPYNGYLKKCPPKKCKCNPLLYFNQVTPFHYAVFGKKKTPRRHFAPSRPQISFAPQVCNHDPGIFGDFLLRMQMQIPELNRKCCGLLIPEIVLTFINGGSTNLKDIQMGDENFRWNEGFLEPHIQFVGSKTRDTQMQISIYAYTLKDES